MSLGTKVFHINSSVFAAMVGPPSNKARAYLWLYGNLGSRVPPLLLENHTIQHLIQ
jgi:hypothetical protein